MIRKVPAWRRKNGFFANNSIRSSTYVGSIKG